MACYRNRDVHYFKGLETLAQVMQFLCISLDTLKTHREYCIFHHAITIDVRDGIAQSV
jgi:hypothetical protein